MADTLARHQQQLARDYADIREQWRARLESTPTSATEIRASPPTSLAQRIGPQVDIRSCPTLLGRIGNFAPSIPTLANHTLPFPTFGTRIHPTSTDPLPIPAPASAWIGQPVTFLDHEPRWDPSRQGRGSDYVYDYIPDGFWYDLIQLSDNPAWHAVVRIE